MITVAWANPHKTVIHIKYIAPYTGDELYQSVLQNNALYLPEHGPDNQVGVIYDFSDNPDYIDTLSVIRRLRDVGQIMYPDPVALLVFVRFNPALIGLVTLFQKMIAKRGLRIAYADNLEEAFRLLGQPLPPPDFAPEVHIISDSPISDIPHPEEQKPEANSSSVVF